MVLVDIRFISNLELDSNHLEYSDNGKNGDKNLIALC